MRAVLIHAGAVLCGCSPPQVLVSIFIAAYPVIEQDWDAVKPGDAPPKELVFTMVLVWLLLFFVGCVAMFNNRTQVPPPLFFLLLPCFQTHCKSTWNASRLGRLPW